MAGRENEMEKTNWFEMWKSDKESMIEVMVSNMVSDLEHGYDYYGKSITEQRDMIDDYKAEFDRQMKALGLMDEKRVQWWCYMDLRRRGAIA